MPLILSLNDLSCESALRPVEVEGCMDGFVALLRAVRALRPDASLIAPERLPEIQIATEYPMRRWVSDARNKDKWRLLRSMQDRTPYRYADVVPTLEADEREYRHNEDLAVGLGIAHATDGLAVSLATDERWVASEVELTRVWIDQDDDLVVVRHASGKGHLEQHRPWLARDGADDIVTGAQLWRARSTLYPDLTFLARVEQDLNALQAIYVATVRNRLFEIQDAIREWDSATGSGPPWRSKITAEHEVRKALCFFEDLDGEKRLFDLHARFTPGVMRLHFRLVDADRTARIAYIGRKIGV